MAKRLIRKLLGCDDKLGIVYLRDSKGFVLWIWMSQTGQVLLVSTWRMMHDLQTEKMER